MTHEETNKNLHETSQEEVDDDEPDDWYDSNSASKSPTYAHAHAIHARDKRIFSTGCAGKFCFINLLRF